MRKWKKSVWAYQLYILAITKLTFLSSSLWRFRVFSAPTVTSSMITVNFILPSQSRLLISYSWTPTPTRTYISPRAAVPSIPWLIIKHWRNFPGGHYKLKFFYIPTWLRIFMMWCVWVTDCSPLPPCYDKLLWLILFFLMFNTNRIRTS